MTVLAQSEAGSSAPRVAWVNAEMDCPWSRKHGSAVNRNWQEWLALTRAVATAWRVVPSGPMPPLHGTGGHATNVREPVDRV